MNRTTLVRVTFPMNSNLEIISQCEKRKIISALRAGVVGSARVESFTVGLKEHLKTIDSWILDKDGTLVIEGKYGTGKSHMNKLIMEKALDSGYGVAYIQFGVNPPMHKPSRIFESVFLNLVFRNEDHTIDIHEILKKYVKKNMLNSNFTDLIRENIFLRPLFSEIKKQIKNDDISQTSDYWDKWNYIIGLNKKSPLDFYYKIPNPEFRTVMNIYFNILCTFSLIARELGYRGIILVFDELEIHDSLLYEDWRRNASDFIDGIFLVTRNMSELIIENAFKNYPLNEYLEFSNVYRGEKTGLLYNAYYRPSHDLPVEKRIRYVPKSIRSETMDLGIKCALSMVTDQGVAINDKARKFNCKRIQLTILKKNDCEQLIENIIAIYTDIYSENIDFIKKFEGIKQEFLEVVLENYEKFAKKNKDATRILIRIAIDALDLLRINPSYRLDYFRHNLRN